MKSTDLTSSHVTHKCHSETKPRNLVFVSDRKDEILHGVYPELCRRAQDDSNRTFANCDTVSQGKRNFRIQTNSIFCCLLGLQGLADAVLLTPPLDVRAKRDGFHLIFSLQELDVPSIYSSILTNLKTLKERPQLVQRFVAAMSETIYFVEKNPERASQSLGKALSINDAEILQSAYQAYARKLVNRRMTVPGKTGAEAVELAREEVAQIRRKADDLYDNSFTDNLVKSGFLKELWGSIP